MESLATRPTLTSPCTDCIFTLILVLNCIDFVSFVEEFSTYDCTDLFCHSSAFRRTPTRTSRRTASPSIKQCDPGFYSLHTGPEPSGPHGVTDTSPPYLSVCRLIVHCKWPKVHHEYNTITKVVLFITCVPHASRARRGTVRGTDVSSGTIYELGSFLSIEHLPCDRVFSFLAK